ncbi:MAG: malate dehydrogenase [Campylobacterales bacterium]|nr:malate dehydrogenase [Campylobacterales bacterium]
MSKVAIIGAGNVGASIASMLAFNQLCRDVVLYDIAKEVAQGKAYDIAQAASITHSSTAVHVAQDMDALQGASVVVITAGSPRKPGMSREDLLFKNASIMKSLCLDIKRVAPESIIIVVSNPLDAMVYVALQHTGFPRERVVGMAGVLDSARMAHAITEAAGFGEGQVEALVIGGHGDAMVPLPRFSTLKGVPIADILSEEALTGVVKTTQAGGARIVSLMGTSAYYAPAAAVCAMVESILKDLNRLMPCAYLLEGEYGYSDIVTGVVVALGRQGVSSHLALPLNTQERNALKESVQEVAAQIMLLNSHSLC